MDENAHRALRKISAAAHTAAQQQDHYLYLPNRWPNTYSADFIRTHLAVLPVEIRAEIDTGIEGRLLSRAIAADATSRWAEAINVPPEAIKTIFADAYLTEKGIPLGAADKERALYAQFIDAATRRPPGTLTVTWCPECGIDDRTAPGLLGPRHYAPDTTTLYREEDGVKVPNICPGTALTLSYDLRLVVPAPTRPAPQPEPADTDKHTETATNGGDMQHG